MEHDNHGYYKLRKNHEKLFDDLCSFKELIFYAEAPIDITKKNIWDYVERLPMEDLLSCHVNSEQESFRLIPEQIEDYPYFQLFCSIRDNGIRFPLIFEQTKDGLVCLEGKHRYHILLVLYKSGEDFTVPCLIVERIEDREEIRFPDGYHEWCNWLKEDGFFNKYKIRKKEFNEKFLRTE